MGVGVKVLALENPQDYASNNNLPKVKELGSVKMHDVNQKSELLRLICVAKQKTTEAQGGEAGVTSQKVLWKVGDVWILLKGLSEATHMFQARRRDTPLCNKSVPDPHS